MATAERRAGVAISTEGRGMNLSRRSFFIKGAVFVACAPAIVRASSLMKIKLTPSWGNYPRIYETFQNRIWVGNGQTLFVSDVNGNFEEWPQ